MASFELSSFFLFFGKKLSNPEIDMSRDRRGEEEKRQVGFEKGVFMDVKTWKKNHNRMTWLDKIPRE